MKVARKMDQKGLKGYVEELKVDMKELDETEGF